MRRIHERLQNRRVAAAEKGRRQFPGFAAAAAAAAGDEDSGPAKVVALRDNGGRMPMEYGIYPSRG